MALARAFDLFASSFSRISPYVSAIFPGEGRRRGVELPLRGMSFTFFFVIRASAWRYGSRRLFVAPMRICSNCCGVSVATRFLFLFILKKERKK